MATLSFRQLSIGYTVSRRQHVVVDDLTGVFPAATLTCLVGRNGTGKSTLLRTLAGLQQPLVGTVLIDDTPLSNLSAIERARLIGVVLTERLEVQNLTVREVVAMGRSPYTGFFGTLSKADWEVVDEALRQVGMSPWADRYVQMLSDGERQKVMIAKALAQQTPVLVLDEPTAFLDYPSKVEMMQLLCRLAKEMDKTIVLSTHDIELAAKIATRFLLLSENGLQEVQASEILMSFSFRCLSPSPLGKGLGKAPIHAHIVPIRGKSQWLPVRCLQHCCEQGPHGAQNHFCRCTSSVFADCQPSSRRYNHPCRKARW